MSAATGGPNVKWGAPISNGGLGTTGPHAGDGPAGRKVMTRQVRARKAALHFYICLLERVLQDLLRIPYVI